MTKYLAFPINHDNKKEIKYYIRDGPNSVPILEKQKKKFLSNDIPQNAHLRQDQEKKMFENEAQLPLKLNNLFLKNQRYIDDKQYHFILITNGLCSEECCRMKSWDSFEWVKTIQWKAVFAFDTDDLEQFVNSRDDVIVKPIHITGNT